MAEQTTGRLDSGTQSGVLRGMLLIAVTGVALGLAYNFLGLHNQTWGVSWIAEDQAEIPTLEDLGGAPAGVGGVDDPLYTESDDPMAIPEAAPPTAGLPEIPDLGRPIQVQLSAAKRFFDSGAVLFVDAREPEEYAAGHIEGAILLPGETAVTDPQRLETLETGGRPLITYCGGGSCELSLSLAHALVAAGHRKVLVFMGGYPEWVDAGYPIATGEAGVH